jgi:hypothetical protein
MPELDGDIEHRPAPFNERMWRVERVTWVVMAALLVLALLGLLGPGPLSDRVAGDKSGPIWVEYERFTRFEAPTELTVHLKRPPTTSQVGVWLAKDYCDRIEIESITPEPASSNIAADGVNYLFDVRADADDAVVTFHIRPRAPGSLRGEIGSGETRLSLDQFAYP